MLTHLTIRNYALIDDLQVDFAAGFTTITGETGAGKSILMEGLGLVLGNRADRSALRDSNEKCIVEAEFTIGSYPGMREFFDEMDLDYEDQCVLRRIIRPNGNSRAFVNDIPTTLETIGALGSKLIDIHSQHQTLELTEQDFQLRVVDALADNGATLKEYRARRDEFLEVRDRLKNLQASRDEAFREHDYNEFLLRELDEAGLVQGMQEELEATQSELSHAGQVIEWLDEAEQLLNDEAHGMLALQARVRQITSRLAGISPRFRELYERIQSMVIESDDIAHEVSRHLESQQADPETLLKINNQLQGLYSLQKKHGVSTVEELLGIRDKLAGKVSETAGLDTAIDNLEMQLAERRNKLQELSDKLHGRRKAILPEFIDRLQAELLSLGMPNAQFKWELQNRDHFGPTGRDAFELLFTANKGGRFGMLKKTASGGELSRIMLVIKSILATYEALPTMMFDEIDTGVSGEISNRMGDIMLKMSSRMQVLAITHLPQVASKGSQQFRVFKEDIGARTQTRMKLLTQEERIQELAQMLGGSHLTDTALTHARQLLN